jgi:hypothetical protein
MAFGSISAEQREADRILTELLNRRDQGTLRERPTKQSLGDWIEEWLTRWCIDVADRTRNDYREILERYLWPDKQDHLHSDKAGKAALVGNRRPPRTSARTSDRLTTIAKLGRSSLSLAKSHSIFPRS